MWERESPGKQVDFEGCIPGTTAINQPQQVHSGLRRSIVSCARVEVPLARRRPSLGSMARRMKINAARAMVVTIQNWGSLVTGPGGNSDDVEGAVLRNAMVVTS